MLSYLALLAISLTYLLVLFGIAWWGDSLAEQRVKRIKPYVVALATTIYCSAWSFYGTTAQAAINGWYFPPTFLGAIILLVFFGPTLKRLLARAKQGSATSLADFLANHFGRSRRLAVVVSIICLILLVPYIALQLKAITESFHLLTDSWVQSHYLLSVPVLEDTAFYFAIILGLFAIAFGTRHMDSREHHNGLMIAIAFEAVIKLMAFMAIALFVAYGLFDGFDDLLLAAAQTPSVAARIAGNEGDQGFMAAVVLGMIAVVCLPRQFHVLVVESESKRDLDTVRWVLPAYLILFGICILPIAYGGLVAFSGQDISADHFVLRLPLANHREDLALLAYLGGLSAGSSMVIVACVAMATMISNELVVPLLIRKRWLRGKAPNDFTPQLRNTRRLIILAIMLIAYGYYHLFANNNALGAIGLLSFALVAQFAPALWLACNHGHQTDRAVLAGIAAGFLVWSYTLLLPMLSRAGWIAPELIDQGPWQLDWLKPTALFYWTGPAEITHGVVWSLLANLLTVALLYRPSHQPSSRHRAPQMSARQLHQLAVRFLGSEQTRLALAQFEGETEHGDLASPAFTDFIENLLAGVIGSTSARHLLEYANQTDTQPLIEETTELFHFSRELLQASIDNISQGISVVDKNLRLVAWNRPYLALFNYPSEWVHVGRPVADLLRFNAEQFDRVTAGELDDYVARRLEFMASGSPYVVTRHLGDQVIELRGNPMPGGGFVTTFTDITQYHNTLNALEEHKKLLEHKVAERTQALEQVNSELKQANESKTRFLAAAGHDVIQPLNAAKLFANALLQQPLPPEQKQSLEQLDTALGAADNIISELLAIAKLDAGAVEPQCQAFALDQLVNLLARDYRPQASQQALRLNTRTRSATVFTDPKLLRRIVQNLLANALRYTSKGGVLLAIRPKGNRWLLQVWDTGQGIPEPDQQVIFEEFKRLDQHRQDGGLGLGLATVKRLCNLLKLDLTLSSTPGKGSCFSLSIPATEAPARSFLPNKSTAIPAAAAFKGLRVLCIDNEPTILQGLSALLSPWGCDVLIAQNRQDALQKVANRPALILADYHLDNGDNGVAAVEAIRQAMKEYVPAIILSADFQDDVKQAAKAAGHYFLKKPVKVAALRALMSRHFKRA
ncbi:PAS domain-containing hybrid sensor histidine kinase/response regulator [Simiduia agarivorans]|uniref:histidine kinase n=1 Tax=Simiduia agarivorans (strain DSM 21679 / JCM 13881 / BCRC 17597 / SA1) TaxID=1117647 RepID=K4KVN0_SIMAS|nr:PAS domain-containing hybrid sensor histidine kinase/response regulator [Simiduia agarivorans]AFU98002.1 two-component system sensor protein [Simiduia agarivorans SA1 = DSM 21679]